MRAFLGISTLALALPAFSYATDGDAPLDSAPSRRTLTLTQSDIPMAQVSGMDFTSDGIRQLSDKMDPITSSMQMTGMYGPYSMNREASGTSWQPDATPDDGIESMGEQWMSMIHGYVDSVYDNQGGPRGGTKSFAESMLMVMSQRQLGIGSLGVRGMFSIDPTIGKAGYPLLFGSGETPDGKTPLIDRQHPHDLIMELATTYSIPLSERTSVFGYFGLPGEPALGPPAFMHRFSGEDIPEAPISHHWLDSTHITEGVATVGYVVNQVKIEGSVFNGREPDQFRYNIETRSFDSASARVSWNPTEQLSLQISDGYLKSPEQLEPDIAVTRRTVSAIYQTTIGGSRWGSTLAWGQNRRSTGTSTGAWLLESTIRLDSHYTIFGRAERLANDELFAPGDAWAGRVFRVAKVSIGAIDDLFKVSHIAFGLGALVSRYAHQAELDPVYGHPTSYMIFMRARIAE